MIGQNINAYFNAAMAYPVDRLHAVIRGQDQSIPAAVAMMALPLKQREVAAATGMQNAQQPPQPSVRQKMEQAMAPQMPQTPQGMQQIPQQSPQVAQLPENTGVMNLPAPNMEKLAGGGIIAFADRGLVDSGYNEYGLPADLSGDDLSWDERLGSLFDSNYRPYRPPVSPTPTKPAAKEEVPPVKYIDATQKGKEEKPPVAEKKKGAGTATGIGVPKMPTTGPSMSYDDYLKKVSGSDKEMMGEYSKLGKEESTGMEALLAEKEKNKPTGKAGESLENYLNQKAISEPQKREENFRMALVNAGLGIAAGNSQFWMQNVANGSKEGIKAYQAGLDKLDEAADKRAQLMASIEDARRAEAKGDWKELYSAKADILKTQTAYRKAGIDALVKITGENRKVAAEMFDTQETNKTRLQQTALAGQYDLAGKKVMAEMYGAKSNPYNIAEDNAAKEYKDWLSSPEGKLASLKPGVADAKKREIYSGAYQRMQLPDPFGAGGKDLFKVLGPET